MQSTVPVYWYGGRLGILLIDIALDSSAILVKKLFLVICEIPGLESINMSSYPKN